MSKEEESANPLAVGPTTDNGQTTSQPIHRTDDEGPLIAETLTTDSAIVDISGNDDNDNGMELTEVPVVSDDPTSDEKPDSPTAVVLSTSVGDDGDDGDAKADEKPLNPDEIDKIENEQPKLEGKDSKNMSLFFRIFIIALVVLCNAGMTLSYKWQNIMRVKDHNDEWRKFVNPIIQSLMCSVGMGLWLPIHCISNWYCSRIKKETLLEGVDYSAEGYRWYHILAAAVFDCGAKIGCTYSLTLTDASMFSMIRSCSILHTTLISMVFLGKRYAPFQFTGIATLFLGLVVVFLGGIYGPNGKDKASSGTDDKSATSKIIGNIVVFMATLCGCAAGNVNEYALKTFKVPPREHSGKVNSCGTVILLIILACFQAAPGATRADVVPWTAQFVGGDWRAPVSVICVLMAACGITFGALTMSKVFSATVVRLLQPFTIIIIWVVCLSLTEYTNEKFSYIQLIGFVVMTSGTFVYARMIPLPCASMCYPEAPPQDSNDKEVFYIPASWLGSDSVAALAEANTLLPEDERVSPTAILFLQKMVIAQERKKRVQQHIRRFSDTFLWRRQSKTGDGVEEAKKKQEEEEADQELADQEHKVVEVCGHLLRRMRAVMLLRFGATEASAVFLDAHRRGGDGTDATMW